MRPQELQEPRVCMTKLLFLFQDEVIFRHVMFMLLLGFLFLFLFIHTYTSPTSSSSFLPPAPSQPQAFPSTAFLPPPSLYLDTHIHTYLVSSSHELSGLCLSKRQTTVRGVHSPHTTTYALNPCRLHTGTRRVSKPFSMTTYEIANKETPK